MNNEKINDIKKDITAHKILLYVKGEKGLPQCGFSATVMNIFEELGCDYETRNILLDPELRQIMKEFSNWPTFPQIYINGEFVGGCDIAIEMFKSGELQKLVQDELNG
jgi:monothiol glutaredoxin